MDRISGATFYAVEVSSFFKKKEWRNVTKRHDTGCVWGDSNKPCPIEVEIAIREDMQ
jgi:hypothetical protein